MRDDPDAIMLFAAGFGTRMGPLTTHKPKPLIEVAGRTLLDHALKQVDQFSVSKKVVNCHYFPEQITSHLRSRNDITVLHEADEILETGGGLKNASTTLGSGPVFTMNTDAVWHGENPLAVLKDAWKPDEMDALLLCVPRANAISHAGKGDFVYGPDHSISYGPGDVYTGLQIIKTERLSEIRQRSFSLKVLWELLLADKRMFGLQYSGSWCDVGSPLGIELAEKMLGYSRV